MKKSILTTTICLFVIFSSFAQRDLVVHGKLSNTQGVSINVTVEVNENGTIQTLPTTTDSSGSYSVTANKTSNSAEGAVKVSFKNCRGEIQVDSTTFIAHQAFVYLSQVDYCDPMRGKWIFEPGKFTNNQGVSNTMYIFENGTRYTYYCTTGDCEDRYKSFTAGDSNVADTHKYTYKNGVLTVDINFGHLQETPITFVCEGNGINFSTHNLVRLGTTCNEFIVTAVLDHSNKKSLTVFPNPFTDQLTFDFNENNSQKIKVLNIEGNSIYEGKLHQKGSINTSDWANGTYFILHKSQNEENVIKVTK